MNIALIFAGGFGKRMNSREKPKQFLEMHGKPIIIYTLEKFENHCEIDAIVVSCLEEWIEYLERLIRQYGLKKVKCVVKGGRTGQLSIYHGLLAAERIANGKDAIVLIHDGVRPLIDQKVVSDNIKGVIKNGSAITCVKTTETVMEVDDSQLITYIPDREYSRLARAPQSFWLKKILKVYKNALEEGKEDFIDSCSMMQYYGKKLFLVEGPKENIKITTPEDFYIMRAIIDAKENAQIFGMESVYERITN